MKRSILVGVCALVVVFGLGLTVWPTPWRYDDIVMGGPYSAQRRFVRTNRLTGQSEYLTDYGWLSMTVQPVSAPIAAVPVVASPSPYDPYADIVTPKR